jgi:hypothetical protein
MSMGSVHGSFTSKAGGSRLFPITIQIKNNYGGWTNVTALSDTGNEISIFKREVADSLGLNLNQGESFNVAGINGGGRQFKRFKLYVRIGNLQPVIATIGFAVNKGDLVENLLGNADIVKSGKFQVTYDNNGVTYTQKALSARVSTCDGDHVTEQEILNNLYEHQSTRRKRYEKDCSDPDEHVKTDEHMNHIDGYGFYW